EPHRRELPPPRCSLRSKSTCRYGREEASGHTTPRTPRRVARGSAGRRRWTPHARRARNRLGPTYRHDHGRRLQPAGRPSRRRLMGQQPSRADGRSGCFFRCLQVRIYRLGPDGSAEPWAMYAHDRPAFACTWSRVRDPVEPRARIRHGRTLSGAGRRNCRQTHPGHRLEEFRCCNADDTQSAQ
ncbi:MAG: hypothetical protein BJ554DRAFT_1248, partial [Olpidium bornovanus]